MSTLPSLVFDAAPFILGGLLAVAAVWDLWCYRIPNWLCLTLAVAMVPVALVHPWGIDWWSHVMAGGLLLAIGVGLYMVGWLGAGDGKLLAAVGLWVGLGDLATVGLYILLAGGALALGLVVLRTLLQGLGTAVPAVGRLHLPTVLLSREPVPYGVAIAAGTLLAIDDLSLLDGRLF